MQKANSKAGSVPLEVIQNIEFGILKFIRDLCDANGLRYYLAYGTLIGAVRHQGFIPWDDDVDLQMPRQDYLTFVEILRKNPHPYYKLVSKETSKKYTYLWPKVVDTRTKLVEDISWIQREDLGFYVDIFILDGAGNTKEEAEKSYRDADNLFARYRRAVSKKPEKAVRKQNESGVHFSLRKIKRTLERALGIRYWMRRQDAFCSEKAYDDYTYIGALGAGTFEASRNIWKREWFGDGVDVIFCGETFRAPVNWDAVLRPEYGNYMELPPMEERHSHHRFEHVEVF